MASPVSPETAIRRAVMRLGRRMRTEAGSTLPAAKLSILGQLHRCGALTAGDLAAADGLQPQSVTRTLADLEGAGYVTRTRDVVDRRVHRITLTQEGRSALAVEMRARDEWLGEAMRRLPDADRVLLVAAAAVLERLADAPPARRASR